MDLFSIVMLAIYIGIILVPIIYNHIQLILFKNSERKPLNVYNSSLHKQHQGTIAPKNNIVIVLGNVDNEAVKKLLDELKQIAAKNNVK